jgi:hypothetical protein
MIRLIFRNVSDRELTRIEGGRIADASLHSKKRSTQPVPYLAVCKNLPIIGVWISCIGGNLGFHIFVQYGPIYLNKVSFPDYIDYQVVI